MKKLLTNVMNNKIVKNLITKQKINNVKKKLLKMMAIIFVILCTISLYLFVSHIIQLKIIEKSWHVKILNNYINVREKADQNSIKIGKVKKGEIYKVLEISLENNLYYFYKIKISDTNVGWIANDKETRSYLEDINNPNDISKPIINVSSNTYFANTIEDINYSHLEVWDDKENYVITHKVYRQVTVEENKYWIVYTVTDSSGKTNSLIQKIIFTTNPEENKVENFIDLSIDYFMYERLSRYLDYSEINSDISLSDVIRTVNANADSESNTESYSTDLSKGNLMLVNKFYKLDSTYVPNDLIDVDSKYGIGKLSKDAYQHLTMMSDAMSLEGLSMYASSTYRSYEYQLDLYNYYVSTEGKEYADLFVALAGHSEHQTGLAVDISSNNIDTPYFENSDEFTWLINNAHLYGFILRYPEGKEHLTGYSYESWHYRYVGVEEATDIYNRDITFDEYYTYFIDR